MWLSFFQAISTTQRIHSPCYNDTSVVSDDKSSNRGSYMHIAEPLIDVSQGPVVRYIFVNLDLAAQVI